MDNKRINTKILKVEYKGNTPPFSNNIYIRSDKSLDEIMGLPKPPEDKTFVIIQNGGVGDTICLTPMLESARKTYPDKSIVVCSSYPELLKENPNIDALYNSNNLQDLYVKWIKPLKYFGSVIRRDLYNITTHKLFPGPISMIWCHLFGVPYYNDNVKLYFTQQEEENAKKFINTFRKNKPIVIIHTSGGRAPGTSEQVTPNKDWDYNNWITLINYMKKLCYIIQVGGSNDQKIPGCDVYLMGNCSLRESAILVKYVKTFVAIDSFISHVGPAVNKKGIVLIGRSNPYIVGHSSNVNIWVNDSCHLNDMHCGRPQGYFGDHGLYNGLSKPWICPDRTCMKAITPGLVLKELNFLLRH